MLSYQHAYHAGNFADVHKHMLLAWMLEYLTRKPKPLTYIETHAGRGLYDLTSAEATKTQEATAGVARLAPWIYADHPFLHVLTKTRANRGTHFYPGSPMIATTLLRREDTLHLCELHRTEYSSLVEALPSHRINFHNRDGFEMAHALCPPSPRRGLIFIDPSFEIKSDYNAIPGHVAKITKAWNVGIVAVWYPILKDLRHVQMLKKLQQAHTGALRHEVTGAPAKEGHGMTGSGMFVVNPPFGLQDAAQYVTEVFKKAS